MGRFSDDSDCRWARHRLPLLAGGDLTGADRRKAERHLIGCPDCRRREAGLSSALDALHAASAFDPPGPSGPPTLWPALARQIREGRHAPRPLSPWLDLFAVRHRHALAAVAASAALLAAWAYRPAAEGRVDGVAAARPPEVIRAVPTPSEAEPDVSLAVADRDSVTRGGSSEPRLDYDLDRGTPMGPGGRDSGSKASY